MHATTASQRKRDATSRNRTQTSGLALRRPDRLKEKPSRASWWVHRLAQKVKSRAVTKDGRGPVRVPRQDASSGSRAFADRNEETAWTEDSNKAVEAERHIRYEKNGRYKKHGVIIFIDREALHRVVEHGLGVNNTRFASTT